MELSRGLPQRLAPLTPENKNSSLPWCLSQSLQNHRGLVTWVLHSTCEGLDYGALWPCLCDLDGRGRIPTLCRTVGVITTGKGILPVPGINVILDHSHAACKGFSYSASRKQQVASPLCPGMTILEGSVVRKRLSVLPVPPHLHVSQHQLISLVPENVSNLH